MRRTLRLHPDGPPSAVTRIVVEVLRPGPCALELRYSLSGHTAGLAIPETAASERADELWRHTCFEAFIRPMQGEAYYEINLSPSTRWAAYRFDGYRSGRSDAKLAAPPRIQTRRSDQGLQLRASLELEQLPPDRPWRLGLSAVIEAADGGVSYWALDHPPGRPDFHHADCFACEIMAPGPP